MKIHATSSFDVTGWEQASYDDGVAGPALSRATVRKAFTGDLSGDSTAELLMCQADTSDLGAGAGYVASERVTGRLGDREGTFVIQHWGVSVGGNQSAGGHVVPGSGTGDLAGLTGDIVISVDPAGAHTLTLDYEIG
ncbi:MAG: DUF3224 domain-containing protein [Gemmatimonadota bacterium]